MARTKGSFNLAGAIEPLASAPLDARATIATKADLTAEGSFPYPYVGMETYVVAENKKYRLIGDDPTDIEDWEEVGAGGTEISSIGDINDVNLTDPTNGQVLQYDETNDEWVNGTVSGATLGSAITSSVSVGGITSGKTYNAGTSYDQMWKDLINPVAYPTLTNPSASLSATGAKLLETGSTLATTMTVSFNRGSINPAYGTSGYRAGAATDYALNGGTAQAENTFSVTVDSSQLSYVATVNYEAGEQPKDSEGNNYNSPLAAGSVNSSAITYEFVDAIWANTSNIATVAKLALVSKGAKQKDFAFPAQTVANPEQFDIPASWTVTAVQVKNDLSGAYENAADQFTVTDTTHDNAAGTSVAYKRYTFNLGYPTGARSVRVKWS